MAVIGAAIAHLLFPAAVFCWLVLGLRVLSLWCRHSFWHRPDIFLLSPCGAPASFLQPSELSYCGHVAFIPLCRPRAPDVRPLSDEDGGITQLYGINYTEGRGVPFRPSS